MHNNIENARDIFVFTVSAINYLLLKIYTTLTHTADDAKTKHVSQVQED